MSEVHAEVACHTPQAGMSAIRLHGGPWDGKEVGVRTPGARFVRVNGPRHGQHSVWITHLYQRRGDRYEFVSTEVIPLSAWPSALGGTRGDSNSAAPGATADRPDD
jgi:hypothetical protein